MTSEETKLCPVCGVVMAHPVVCIACGHEMPPQRTDVIVGNRYRLGRRLGGGGVGEVYAAHLLSTGEPIAVKFLLGHWARVPEFRKRFQREAVALARLQHPGIVRVVDFGEHEGDLYLAMELVRGVPLGELVLVDGVPMALDRVAAIFAPILEVLELAHAAGIIHRDLKPDNVMITHGAGGGDQIKLLDFGLASLEEGEGAPRLTASGTVQGTPAYMSPEQCRGQRVGPPTDVYATGIMLFEVLAGALPFNADNMAGFMAQHMFVVARPIRELGVKREVAPGLEALVRRAIAKDAAERPTAAQFRADLHAVMSGTDAVSVAARGVEARMQTAGLSRDERALPEAKAPPDPGQGPTRLVPEGARPVVLWADDDVKTRLLRDALAVNGVATTHWTEAAPPKLEGAGAVILYADARVAERARAVTSASRAMRILVIGAADAMQTAQLIRLGASDVALASLGDDGVSKKVIRLMKRGR